RTALAVTATTRPFSAGFSSRAGCSVVSGTVADPNSAAPPPGYATRSRATHVRRVSKAARGERLASHRDGRGTPLARSRRSSRLREFPANEGRRPRTRAPAARGLRPATRGGALTAAHRVALGGR